MGWDLVRTLASLARTRPVFYSEADFQHAFAWESKRLNPQLSVRLEVPRLLRYRGKAWQSRIDLRLEDPRFVTWLEFKYATAPLSLRIEGDSFELKDHSAVAEVRSGFWADVERLEQTCRLTEAKAQRGYAVFLTNRPAHWLNGGWGTAQDQAFRLIDSRTYTGRLVFKRWREGGKAKGPWVLSLRGSYRTTWHDYSRAGGEGHSLFRYFAVAVAS